MMFFRQLFVLRLHLVKVVHRLHAHGFPGAPLLRAQLPAGTGSASGLEIEKSHRVIEQLLGRLAGGEFPAWPFPGRGTPDFSFERRALKPFIIVPGLVVGANMLKTEPEIVTQSVTRFRRRIMRLGYAPLGSTEPCPAVLFRLSVVFAGDLDLWSRGASHSIVHFRRLPPAGK